MCYGINSIKKFSFGFFSTSFRHAARQASLVEVKIRALSWPWIIEFGTRSKFQGLLQTLSGKIDGELLRIN